MEKEKIFPALFCFSIILTALAEVTKSVVITGIAVVSTVAWIWILLSGWSEMSELQHKADMAYMEYLERKDKQKRRRD